MSSLIIKEACAENFSEVPEMIRKGANRIELNDNMSAWGTTPSVGNIVQTIKYCELHDIPVIVMNRPRGGNFVYSKDEKAIIMKDLEVIASCGVAGIAVGALTEENKLDKSFLKEVFSNCQKNGLEITFHRAFDSIPRKLQEESLNWLANQGVTRIATHGGPDEYDILENANRLKELSKMNKNIKIMAGGGVTKENVNQVIHAAEITEVHGTKIV